MFAARLNLTSYLLSAILHASALLLLALWIVPNEKTAPLVLTVAATSTPLSQAKPFELPLEPLAELSDYVIASSDDSTVLPFDIRPAHDEYHDVYLAQPQHVLAVKSNANLSRDQSWFELPSQRHAFSAIVNDYGAALQQLGAQISNVLQYERILLVWCFDQSLSMKDDQQQIREQIDSIYRSVSVSGRGRQANVLSAITSYGAEFSKQSRKPTSNLAELRRAIDAIPVDSTGFERMCAAVQRAIDSYQRAAAADNRQLILLLVTDETGDRQGNQQLLEQVIATARQQQCRIFVLGREACFGTSTAFMKWRGEQLQIDRGPESAFAEQLAFDGLGRRQTTINSGFAPYEQARLAQETGGGLYLITGLEPTLLNTQITVFDAGRMETYRPDLRARELQSVEREQNRFHLALKEVIESFDDLEASRYGLPLEFPAERTSFDRMADNGIHAAEILQNRYAALQEQLDDVATHRANEPPRWQANYDLIYGQLLAYQTLCREYQSCLHQSIREKKALGRVGPRGAIWVVQRTGGCRDPETRILGDEATRRLLAVQQEHSGTPWALRAKMELEQGFSVQLAPK